MRMLRKSTFLRMGGLGGGGYSFHVRSSFDVSLHLYCACFFSGGGASVLISSPSLSAKSHALTGRPVLAYDTTDIAEVAESPLWPHDIHKKMDKLNYRPYQMIK
jgi:hypothetical protein